MATVERMPVVFLGHGSPMNALEKNAFTAALGKLGERLGKPRAVLCISAHWMTTGTWVTRMEAPQTIHDFAGFPEALFQVEYPAPGSPEVADAIRAGVAFPKIQADDEHWGLDHGAWAVLRHVYPNADVPVVQLSLDLKQPAPYHFELGKKLRKFRDEGILLVGSGNIVHNLRQVKYQSSAPPYDWAVEFDRWAKERIEARDFASLVNDYGKTPAGQLSVPTPEHYYPFLYILGASDESDSLRVEYEEIQNASISMRSVTFA